MGQKKWFAAGVCITMLASLFTFSGSSAAADIYDGMRDAYRALLAGGSGFDPSDPDIAAKVEQIEDAAQGYWEAMDKSAARTYLWSDLSSGANGFHVRDSYWRLRAMALAYQVQGSAFQGNESLAADIAAGLEWLNAHWYSTSTGEPGNWFEWKISIPFYLLDTAALMYDRIPAASLNSYTAAVDKHRQPPGSGDANGLWGTKVLLLNNVLKKNGSALGTVKSTIEDALKYRSTYGNGFFDDGSYIDHTGTNSPNTPGYPGNPYNGGYGRGFYKSVAEMMMLLSGTAWDINPAEKQVICEWTFNAFEPFLYRGGVMSFVQGREMSRPEAQEHRIGHEILESVIWLSASADAENKSRMESMIKYQIESDTYRDFYRDVSIYTIAKAKAIAASAVSRGDLTLHRTFARMDRVVHSRPGYAFGVAMNGHVINYEQINAENLHGWHYGQGAVYLYNGDLDAYDDEYHPTVNAYRLAGTTAQAGKASNFNPNQSKWAGGADLGEFGAAGMELKPDAESLQAKKSWFMFDNEIVAIGSDISAAGGLAVETTVENRKLNAAGTNVLTVNGTAKGTELGWSETMTGVRWAHLQGTSAGADIGYFFPNVSTLKAIREERSGKWYDINRNAGTSGDLGQIHKRNYLTMWFDHGVNPTPCSYAYALLPNMTSGQVAAYAAAPEFTILEQSGDAHGVKESGLGITAVNFWNDAVKTVGLVTSNRKSSVIVRESADQIEVAVADPTQLNTGAIEIELGRPARGILETDSRITVTQLSPTIKMTVNVNGAYGRTMLARFGLSTGNPLPKAANLALNKPATASSTVNGGVWNVARATDGQRFSGGTSNGWTSNASLTVNHAEWFQADLGAVYSVDRVDLYPRSDSGNVGQGFPADFKIQVSADGTNWNAVVSQAGYPRPGSQAQSFVFPKTDARYVRVLGTNLRPNPSDGGLFRMQLAEVEVYEAVDVTPPVTVHELQGEFHDGWYRGTVMLTLSAEDAESGVAETVYSLDGGRDWIPYLGPITFSEDGRHAVSYRSTDYAGNAEETTTALFSLDGTPPAIEVFGAADYTVEQQVRITCSANDPLSGVAGDPCSVPLVDVPAYELEPGDHEGSVQAEDRAGNAGSATFRYSVGVTPQSLISLTERFVSGEGEQGLERALAGKIENGRFEAYIRQVSALAGDKIGEREASVLTRYARVMSGGQADAGG
ncbi:hypothetical protein GE107_21155 [Cohnella sp. CFH 77786]|uniref:polysaccharide lyase family 8 super-sandwich domain-containing protein n=1 Tax=Cohnella sp. CFH 77786 TaxID=2662265 RepID=UPI001C60945D|nr:polysaccharide lyase family 8 super-sandwich domain-containing protein [Cohnella sp. CFH 77786]MBW5448559.1 hypothetical protein [Cohnella sp. CFH 77786]